MASIAADFGDKMGNNGENNHYFLHNSKQELKKGEEVSPGVSNRKREKSIDIRATMLCKSTVEFQQV